MDANPLPGPESGIPDRFQVLEDLGDHGGAQLLRARDTVLGREVFLKRPGEELQAAYCEDSLRERGLREARALANIKHVGMERLLDALETDRGPLLVLEPTQGESLRRRLEREGLLSSEECIELGISIADVLEDVHEAGLVHRGITADCIVIDHGNRARLTGFHLAKDTPTGTAGGPSSLVIEPETDGSASGRHPAPEQMTRGEDDPRSDLFGLAWVLFEGVTGHAPYAGRNPLLWDAPRGARELVPEIPVPLERVLAKSLSVSPSGRPESARALRVALEELRAPTPEKHSTRRSERLATTAWSVTALCCAALLGLLLFGAESAPAGTGSGEAAERGRARRAHAGGQPVNGDYAPFYDQSHALLIGIGNAYDESAFKDLPNAERDVEALATSLSKNERGTWNIQMLLGERATENNIIDAVTALSDRVGPNDRVLIYFAGHGVPHKRSGKSGWLIPADAKKDAPSSWVHFDLLRRVFDEARAKHILVALDCCFAGRMAVERSADATPTEQKFSQRYLRSRARFVLASGRANEKVSDGTAGGHSPFAGALLQIHAGEGPLTTSSLFVRIEESLGGKSVAQKPVLRRIIANPSDREDDGRYVTRTDDGEFVFFRKGS